MFAIIDREHRRIVSEHDTRDEAEARLAELIEEDPGVDGILFVTGDSHRVERA